MKLTRTRIRSTGILPVGTVGVSPAYLFEPLLSATSKVPVRPTDKMFVPL
jgi:hypothetical protein